MFKSPLVQKRVETNGRTDGHTDVTDCFIIPANTVGNNDYVSL